VDIFRRESLDRDPLWLDPGYSLAVATPANQYGIANALSILQRSWTNPTSRKSQPQRTFTIVGVPPFLP